MYDKQRKRVLIINRQIRKVKMQSVMMKYIIKHKNVPIIKFDLLENLADPQVHITWIMEEKTLLPVDLSLNDEACLCKQFSFKMRS